MSVFSATFWVNGHDDVVSYKITADDRKAAINEAERRLIEEGYEDWNLKQITTA